MQVQSFAISGPALITPKIFGDERGFFTERFRADAWRAQYPEHTGFVQDNFSFSHFNVLRGLHFQYGPDQGKLVTCTSGVIWDVIVDIRPSSTTLGRHVAIELRADQPQWFWVPPGFAHGFQVTSPEGAGVLYKVDQPYTPSGESAIRWDDPELAIPWPRRDPLMSAKDQVAGTFIEHLASLSLT